MRELSRPAQRFEVLLDVEFVEQEVEAGLVHRIVLRPERFQQAPVCCDTEQQSDLFVARSQAGLRIALPHLARKEGAPLEFGLDGRVVVVFVLHLRGSFEHRLVGRS